MKKVVFLIAFVLFAGVTISNAQSAKELRKERKEIQKVSKEELNRKSEKSARKEAKRLKKEGWGGTPGALPMEKQLDNSFLMQCEYDSNNKLKYIMGNSVTVGESADAAFMQAAELARHEIIAQVEADVTTYIRTYGGNEQMSKEKNNSVLKTVLSAGSIMSQKIYSAQPVLKIYRALDNGNVEVSLTMACSREEIFNSVKNIMDEELLKEGKDIKVCNETICW